MLPYGFLGSLVFDLVSKRAPVKKIPLWFFLTYTLGMAVFATVLFLLIVLFGGGLEVPLGPYILLALGGGGLLGLIGGGIDWLIWFRKDYKKIKEEGV